MADEVTVTLPDGSQKKTRKGIRIIDFVRESIGQGLAKAAIIAAIDGEDVDLARAIDRDVKLTIFTTKSEKALDTARHDAAHVVADAVQRLFPGTQVTIGPTIEDGFYYDFSRETPFTPEDLDKIEKEANAEIQKDLPFVRREVSPADAVALFQGKGETFKVEIVNDIVQRGA